MPTEMPEAGTPPYGRMATLRSGLKLHYHEQGSGSTVVLIHGSGPGASGYSNFFLNYAPIAQAGHRVLIPDLPGFGWSSKPTGITYDLELFTSALMGLLDLLGVERCALVGNSLGGAIAIKMALDHPYRIEKLCVMGPGGLESRETYFKMPGIEKMVREFVGDGFDRASLRRLLELLTHEPRYVSDELLEQRWNVLQTQPKDVLARMSIADLSGDLHKIRCPLLGFWGIEDLFCPSSGHAKVLHAVPDSRFIMYSRCGHWAMIERSEDFNRHAIEFLRS